MFVTIGFAFVSELFLKLGLGNLFSCGIVIFKRTLYLYCLYSSSQAILK